MKKILVMILGISLLTGCGCSKDKINEEDIVKENVQQDVIKDQQLEVFTFTNTSLTYQKNTSVLVTKVTNTSSNAEYLKEFKIHVWNEDGEKIVTLTGFIGSNIAPGESRTINSSYGSDLTNAASITYEIVR